MSTKTPPDSDASFLLTLSQAVQLLAAAGAPSTDVETLLLLMQVSAVRQSPSSQSAAPVGMRQQKVKGSSSGVVRTSTPLATYSDRVQESNILPRNDLHRPQTSDRAATPSVASASPLAGPTNVNDLSLRFKAGCAIEHGSPRTPSLGGSHSPALPARSSHETVSEDLSQRSPARLAAIAAALRTIPRAPLGSSSGKKEWFAIVVGERVGVVYSWFATAPYVLFYSGNVFKGYRTREEALQRFWEGYPQFVRSGTGIVLGIEDITYLTPRAGRGP